MRLGGQQFADPDPVFASLHIESKSISNSPGAFSGHLQANREKFHVPNTTVVPQPTSLDALPRRLSVDCNQVERKPVRFLYRSIPGPKRLNSYPSKSFEIRLA